MIEIRQTDNFVTWFADLKDLRARARIEARLRRVELGNFGVVEAVGEGVSELKVDYGPGYRVYIAQRAKILVIVLGAGTKKTQDKDIRSAILLARDLE